MLPAPRLRLADLLTALMLAGLTLASGARAAAPAASSPHPPSAYLPGVGYVAQSWNNCGPASIVSVLNYYGVQADQAEVARVLRPAGGYMPAGVIPPFVQRYGLKATRFRGGTLEYLRQLTAAGVPVIVLQWLRGGSTVPHFRVVRGYDDRSGLVWLSDPVYGPNVYVGYAQFQQLWNLSGQEFIPVYAPSQTATVARILGVRL